MPRKPVLPVPAATGVDAELAEHIAQLTKKYRDAGLDEIAARAKAIERFGDLADVRDECRTLAENMETDMRRTEYMQEIKLDALHALRTYWRAPVFSIVAVLTLAIGIGANTAIFSVVRSVLLRPLPYAGADRLVQVWSDATARGRKQPEWLTPPDFADWRSGNRTFESMASYQGWGPDLTGSGDPETLTGFAVSGDYFSVLGAKPAIGRLLTMADDDAGTQPVVVLSHALWERRFGGDSAVLNRTITLGGTPWTVVGVLPRDFQAPLPANADVFRTARRPANGGCGRGCVVLRVVGRLKPGVSLADAKADLGAIAARIARDYPQTNDKLGVWLIPLHEQLTGPTRASLFAMSGAVALVLLIGCVNLANLLLVRGAGRAREFSVRAALGAGRARLVRQLLTENVVLAGIGGVLGLALGIAGSHVLATLVPDSVRRVQDVHADGAVFLFAAGATIVSALMFGLLPAVHAARSSIMTTLRSSGGEAGRRSGLLRGGLAVVQLSLAVVLLVGAGLLLRSFLLMERVDLGYRADGVLLAPIALPAARYQPGPLVATTVDNLLARVRANPAVRAADVTDLPPLTGGDQDITAIPVDEPAGPDQPESVWYRSVSPGYIATMHMRMIAGRGFTAADRQGSALVGIVNEEAARRFWHGKNPLGRQLSSGRSPDAPKLTIVGVVASVRHDGPNQPYKAELFLPYDQVPARAVTLVVEPAHDAASATRAIRDALRETDALVPAPRTVPIEARVGDAVSRTKLYATLVGVFACAALLLAVLGVYGVMAYTVAERQREIGVRLALGAAPSSIARIVLGQGGLLALMGVAVGLTAALLLGRVLGALLFGVTAFDAPVFVVVPAVLGGMTLLASWIPARRAMRVDPLIAIRGD